MSKAISTMNSKQIKERLAVLDSAEAELSARDYDAELSAALLNGEDVDALEQRQLEAERLARRLRVERQALLGAQPEAAKRDAKPVLLEIEQKMEERKLEAQSAKVEILENWQSLRQSLEKWSDARMQTIELLRQANITAHSAKLPASNSTSFADAELMEAGVRMRDMLRPFLSHTEHDIYL